MTKIMFLGVLKQAKTNQNHKSYVGYEITGFSESLNKPTKMAQLL